MRVLNTDPASDGSSSSHSHHGHSHSHAPVAKSSALEDKPKSELRKRTTGGNVVDEVAEKSEEVVEKVKEISSSLRLSAYLNLFGDFSE